MCIGVFISDVPNRSCALKYGGRSSSRFVSFSDAVGGFGGFGLNKMGGEVSRVS